MKHGIVDCFLNIFACVKLEQLYAIAFFIFSFLHEKLLSHMYDLGDREVEMQQFDIHRYYFFNYHVCAGLTVTICNACEQ